MAVGRGTFASFQSLVSLLAGLASLSGAAYSAVRFLTPTTGHLVAIVHAAPGDRPLPGATVEVLTPTDAVVTTLAGGEDGTARSALPEGTYRLRVTAPRFDPQTRDVDVHRDAVAEIRFALAARDDPGTSSRRLLSHPVSRSVGAAQRFLQKLGM